LILGFTLSNTPKLRSLSPQGERALPDNLKFRGQFRFLYEFGTAYEMQQ
jgi:hypothetical protein